MVSDDHAIEPNGSGDAAIITATPPKPLLAMDRPVAVSQRIENVDTLRGVALLGILVINIDFFAFPMAVFYDPSVIGGFTGLNLLTWKFGSLFFLEKMMSIFSMLFGGGLILMYDRAEQANRKLGGVYYRRMMWLLVIGLIHAYFIWYGDILFSYAICGLVLFPFRRKSPRLLLSLGVISLLIGALFIFVSGISLTFVRNQAMDAQTALDAGETPTALQQNMLDSWNEFSAMMFPDKEKMQEEIESMRGGYGEVLAVRVPLTIMMETQGFIFRVLWRVLGLMLIGMAFIKTGVLTGARSLKFYILSIIIGYGAGLPLVGWGIGENLAHGFDVIYWMQIGSQFNYFGSLLVCMGHVGLVMLIAKLGLLRWLLTRLAAVGRMALSNYLIHSIICSLIFYGYGLGLFGVVERFWLLMIVIAIWIVQLIYSPIWLRHYYFGPAEWLWRSLTYWKRQPMRVTIPSDTGAT